MKKKRTVLVAGICAAALLMTGCSKEISNDYITVKQYKGVEVEKQTAEKITDELVESQIQAVLEQNATTEQITDRAVEDGDTVTIDYEGKVDGVAFDNGAATDSQITIGEGRFIPGFEEGVTGHNIGETFDMDVTFPEDYQSEDLAGKAAVFTVTIKAISKQNVPELNDEFVKTVSKESTTVEDYKKEVKKSLEENSKKTAEENLKTAAWTALLENVEIKKYPQDDLKKMIEDTRTQFEELAEQYQMEFADFLEAYAGMDEDTFNSRLSQTAKDQVKQDLTVELIAKKEKLNLSDKELEEKYEGFVETYGYESVEKMKEEVSEENLKKAALKETVQKWVVDNCKQVEKKESTDDSSSK